VKNCKKHLFVDNFLATVKGLINMDILSWEENIFNLAKNI